MEEQKRDIETIEKYSVKTEEINIEVSIKGEQGKPIFYYITIPKISRATLALVDEIRKDLIAEVKISAEEMLDPREAEKTKEKFKQKASTILDEKITLEPGIKKILITLLMNEMLGLGEIEFLLSDANLEEISISTSSEPIRVYHKKYGWLDTNIMIKNEEQIMNYATIIARRAGRQISALSPILDAHLITGDRANAILYPVATKGNSITIRKFARDPWTIVDFINYGTITSKLASLIWIAMQYEMTILVSGGTGSGKTSFLNVMMPFIPFNQRIVTIEQTRELQLPSYLHWVPMVTRLPNPEGKGEVNMLDLMVNSLRMRPDRIVLGEIRRREEAEVLFEAIHTGHSVYATVHADTLNETIKRLVNPPISVPENLLETVNLCVTMFRDRRKGIRRVYQVGEFIYGEETEGSKVKPNLLFRYKPIEDKIVAHAKSLTLFDNISRITGMSIQEINRDMNEKEQILDAMVKQKIRSLEEVGKIMNDYYINKDRVLKLLKIKR